MKNSLNMTKVDPGTMYANLLRYRKLLSEDREHNTRKRARFVNSRSKGGHVGTSSTTKPGMDFPFLTMDLTSREYFAAKRWRRSGVVPVTRTSS